MTMPIYGEKLQKSSSLEPRGRWPWNVVYSIGYLSATNVFIRWPWVDLDHFLAGQICFRMLLHGWKLIQHWVLMYFQVCSNSAYPQHSGEWYRTSGPLVIHDIVFYSQPFLYFIYSWVCILGSHCILYSQLSLYFIHSCLSWWPGVHGSYRRVCSLSSRKIQTRQRQIWNVFQLYRGLYNWWKGKDVTWWLYYT